MDLHATQAMRVTWTIIVEMFFYTTVFLTLFVGEKIMGRRAALTALAVGALVMFAITVLVPGGEIKVFGIFIYSPLFILGGSLFYFRQQRSYVAGGMFTLSLILTIYWYAITNGWTVVGLNSFSEKRFVNLISFFVLFGVFVGSLNIRNLPRFRPLDRVLGDMTYPFYLIHLPLNSLMVIAVLPAMGIEPKGVVTFLILLLLSAIVTWALIIGIETPMARLRNRLRGTSFG